MADNNEKYTLADADYLDLWKYFEARADSLKQSMFQTVTWIIGFATAVGFFILATFVDFEGLNIVLRHRGLAVLSCLVGLILCIYALFLLAHFAAHINRNWNRAKACKNRVEGLTDIVSPSTEEEEKEEEEEENQIKWIQIWHVIGSIVLLFALGFVVTAFLFAFG